MQKQIFTTQTTLSLPSSQNPINLSVSAYSDSLLVIINQTGALGSILAGEIDSQIDQSDFDDKIEEEMEFEGKESKKQNIYEIKVMFGSTQIEFYEMLMRKILSLVFQESQVKNREGFRIIGNLSLCLKEKNFDELAYYKEIQKCLSKMLKQVL